MGLLDAIRALLGGGSSENGRGGGSPADDPLRRYRDRCETLDEVRRRLEHWYDEPDRD